MRNRLPVFLALVLLYVCCDGDNRDDYYNYLESSYIDTVLVGDTVAIGASVPVVHVYPFGCNSFERLDCVLTGTDTLLLDAVYRFKFEGKPCAHGSGFQTTEHVLCFGGSMTYVLRYRRNDTTTVHQSVFAE